MNRRSFLKTAFAFSTVPYIRTFAAQAKPYLRMGILSDVHVRKPGWSLDPLIGALKWFDTQKVDGVVIAGDIADQGLTEQLRHAGAAWDSIFPDNRAADGRAVEKVFVTGNHDNHFWKHPSAAKIYPDEKERFEKSIAKDFNAAWQECFHEDYIRLSRKEIKGYTFIGRHYATPGIGKYMHDQKASLDPSKPFFYVQHQHLKDTCYGSWAWGQDKGDSTKALSKFPNAVAFSGHSHYSLTDERSVWQGSFTSIGTASLSYIVASGKESYENVRGEGKEDRVKEMSPFSMRNGKHGMLMDVFADKMVFSRWNFNSASVESLGEDWSIPLPFAEPPPFSFASRAKKVAVPQFPAKSTAKAAVREGENRERKKHQQVVVTFPVATDGGRAHDYEIQVIGEGSDKPALVRYVISATVHLPRKYEKGEASCVFAASELPSKCKFVVYPRNSYGKSGNPLSTTFQTIAVA
ncbi:MAG: metallophosphoesterase [Kiritimatiellae bacterium]|nr:metallophosphoesterase [Kiritimatiellia bacterium]